jgi:hypothetical protein
MLAAVTILGLLLRASGEFVPGGTTGSDAGTANAAFAQPAACSSLDCDLRLGVGTLHLPNAVRVRSRLFNGGLPGPTIRASAGDTVRVRLVNLLQDVANGDDLEVNEKRHPNSTNLHTHGLHISPLLPSDDPHLEISPGGGEYTFQLALPDYHSKAYPPTPIPSRPPLKHWSSTLLMTVSNSTRASLRSNICPMTDSGRNALVPPAPPRKYLVASWGRRRGGVHRGGSSGGSSRRHPHHG